MVLFQKFVSGSLLVTTLSLGSCSNSTNLPYSSLARSTHLSLKTPGYIVGFEKVKKGEAGLAKSLPHQDVVRYPSRYSGLPNHRKYKRYFDQEIIDEARPIIPTHIAAFKGNESGPQFIYNAYQDHPRSTGVTKTEALGWNHLEKLREDVRSQLRTSKYTHVVVMAMGWNNDQHDAIFRYNKIIDNMKNAQGKSKFSPLTIGVTWPSAWGTRSDVLFVRKTGHFFSYFNKSDDADELGLVYLNWLLHSAIPDAQPSRKVPVIAIGHSFGARALSRAIHSRDYLTTPNSEREPIALYVGLQAAVSINRYLPGKSYLRGSAYAEAPLQKTMVIYTSSHNDSANAVPAFITGAKNIGSKHGSSIASSSPLLDLVTLDSSTPNLTTRPRPGIPLVVDVSRIVRKGDSDGFETLSAHNDILDAEMGQFLRSCVDLIR